MLGRDVLISWVRNIPWSSQKTKDFRREIIWDFLSSIWDFFAIFCQDSHYRTRFQASSGKSDSANWPGYEAVWYQFYPLTNSLKFLWGMPKSRSISRLFSYPPHTEQERNLYFWGMTLRKRRGDTLFRPRGRILALVFEEAPVTSLSERWISQFLKGQISS